MRAIACLVALMTIPTGAQAAEWKGAASYYALHSKTALGRKVAPKTAAHRTLPFGSRLRVTNLANRQSTTVTVMDRGPFVKGRVIDVSKDAAQALGFVDAGVAQVRVELESR